MHCVSLFSCSDRQANKIVIVFGFVLGTDGSREIWGHKLKREKWQNNKINQKQRITKNKKQNNKMDVDNEDDETREEIMTTKDVTMNGNGPYKNK